MQSNISLPLKVCLWPHLNGDSNPQAVLFTRVAFCKSVVSVLAMSFS